MLKAIIFGAPGAGKGTYASRLQAKLGVYVISMGDIFRELIKENSDTSTKVKSFMEKGTLVPDDIVVEVLKQHLSKISKGKGFILDGYPRTLDQAKKLEAITPIDVIMQLNVPDWIIIERLSTRRICKKCGAVYNLKFLKPKVEGICDKCGGPLYQRSDDNPETIKNRLKIYQEQTTPLIAFYKEKKVPFIELETITLEQQPEPMVEKLFSELKNLKWLRCRG
jgi:adenylate kinase